MAEIGNRFGDASSTAPTYSTPDDHGDGRPLRDTAGGHVAGAGPAASAAAAADAAPSGQQVLVDCNATRAASPREPRPARADRGSRRRARPTPSLCVRAERRSPTPSSTGAPTSSPTHLRALGVGPDVLVGICLERSLEHAGRPARHAEGRRRLRAARPRLPGRAARLHARGRRGAGRWSTHDRCRLPCRRTPPASLRLDARRRAIAPSRSDDPADAGAPRTTSPT